MFFIMPLYQTMRPLTIYFDITFIDVIFIPIFLEKRGEHVTLFAVRTAISPSVCQQYPLTLLHF